VKALALAALLAVWSRWCGAESGDVKVYHVADDDQGKLWLVATSVYRADAEKQMVMSWFEGAETGPERLPNCTVRDSQHWRCEDRNGSGSLRW
jgi:hypothetical protein